MKFNNTKVMNFDGALRGMRNPMNSWDKSDSNKCVDIHDCYGCVRGKLDKCVEYSYAIGENDMSLAQKLIRAGSEHRKFMRQIFVSVDITAPLYWWKEFDTYKVGTVANSTSTMHKLATTPITLECFEIDDYDDSVNIMMSDGFMVSINEKWNSDINYLEQLRKTYNKTKDKKYWKELIRQLPESWLQTRTVTMSYENLLAICSKGQRRFHKLNEWSGQDDNTKPNFISWARTLPYAQELIFIDEVEE